MEDNGTCTQPLPVLCQDHPDLLQLQEMDLNHDLQLVRQGMNIEQALFHSRVALKFFNVIVCVSLGCPLVVPVLDLHQWSQIIHIWSVDSERIGIHQNLNANATIPTDFSDNQDQT